MPGIGILQGVAGAAISKPAANSGKTCLYEANLSSPGRVSASRVDHFEDNFAGVEQSLQEGLNGMTKVQDWSIMFLLLRLPMIHGWVIRAEGIVQDIPIGKGIYEKKIVSEMAILVEASLVRENSIQPLKIVVIFSSDRI